MGLAQPRVFKEDAIEETWRRRSADFRGARRRVRLTITSRGTPQAQLALATGMEVNVLVDESKKHNGYCFASRIDVISP